MLEECKIGDIILLKEGRNNKLISHTELGKVIIPINEVRHGYAKVLDIVKIAKKYILVKVENIIYDYYDDIKYEEFKEVLKLNNFKIGFDRPFAYIHGIEHQILAYNINNGVIIVAETYYGSDTFNSIEVYCPNINGLKTRLAMQSRSSSTMTVLNLCFGKNFRCPLKWINNIIENKNWNSRDDINLWTYADDDTEYNTGNKYGFEAYSLWENTIDRILLVDNEIEIILGNCTRLKPVFKTRNELFIY